MTKESDHSISELNEAVPRTTVLVTLALLSAAWLAAGASGVLAHPLRKVLVLIFMMVATIAMPRAKAGLFRHILNLVIVWLPAGWLLASEGIIFQIAAVAWQAVMMTRIGDGRSHRIHLSAATSLTVFLLYRWVVGSIAWVWLWGDLKARLMGQIVGGLLGQSLRIGMVFAAFDLWLLVVLLVTALWLQTPAPRGRRGLWLVVVVTLPQLFYWGFVAYLPILHGWLQGLDPDKTSSWISGLLKAVPWQVPWVAWLLHMATMACTLYGLPGLMRSPVQGKRSAPALIPWKARQRWVVLGLALLLPVVTSLHASSQSLEGKKIVFSEKGFLNWLTPEYGSYGRLSSGMYGVLPKFIQSLGAQTLISAELSPEDLQGADVVVLLFPDDPWGPGQRERIWEFVRSGGTLLLMAEHTTQDPNGASRFNEILEPTAMRVTFDSATFAVGGWLHSYEALVHPATVGIGDRSNDFGVVIGASLDLRWPARPLLIGRWGWSDRGDLGSSRAMMGNDVYDAGEKLGDLILAAEQPLGKGRVVAFGDTSGLTNGINVGSHDFNRRLLTYLAQGKSASPAWRQIFGLVLFVGLVFILMRGSESGKLMLAVAGVTLSAAATLMITERSVAGLPDGRPQTPNNVAYIDATHLGAHSSESWRDSGIGGLVLTLMRNQYIPLHLNEFTRERLSRAGLLLCLSPRRSFSPTEIKIVQDYVNAGGLLMITGGYEHFGEQQSLLEAFDFRVGRPLGQRAQPRALGHFKAPYLRSENARVFVRFHASWPVYCSSPEAQVLAYGADNLQVAMWRPWGGGKVVVIGDTAFAQNRNLEHEDGSPFEGLRENADFWRWLLSWLRDQDMWVPPPVREQSTVPDLDLDLGLGGLEQ